MSEHGAFRWHLLHFDDAIRIQLVQRRRINAGDVPIAKKRNQVILDHSDVVGERDLAVLAFEFLLHAVNRKSADVTESARDDGQVFLFAYLGFNEQSLGAFDCFLEVGFFSGAALPVTIALVSTLPCAAVAAPVDDQLTFKDDVSSFNFYGHTATL